MIHPESARQWEAESAAWAKTRVENNRLRSALAAAKEKLEIYRRDQSGDYLGGMEYSALIRKIDQALKPD